MKFSLALFFSLSFTLLRFQLFSQGCSDAGVCSVGSLSLLQFKFEILHIDEIKLTPILIEDPELNSSAPKNSQEDSTILIPIKPQKDSVRIMNTSKKKYYSQNPKHSFQFTTSYGLGEKSTSVITTQLEGNFRIINQKLFAQIKLPLIFISGKLADINGLGDPTISLSYIAFIKSKTNLSITGGIKIPTNNANISKDNLPLPMVYQTSLGTTDALIGLKYTYKKWDFTIGYQHPFNTNKNKYIHNSLSKDSASYNSYFESNSLKRSDDAVFRINRNILSKKLNASAGLLFIYHMTNDYFTDISGERVSSKGSQGLTLNLHFSGIVPVSKKLDFVFIYANPLIIRKSRPDGLTRSFVIILGLKYNIF